MSKNNAVTFFPLIRNLSTEENYSLDEIDSRHSEQQNGKETFRSNSKGENKTEFGSSSSATIDHSNPEESNKRLWWTRQEQDMAKTREMELLKRRFTIDKVMEKRKEFLALNEVLDKMKEAKIKDSIFNNYIDKLKKDIRDLERDISNYNKYIYEQDTLINNVLKEDIEDSIIIEERHKHHTNNNDWIKSVMEKLPYLDEQYITMRYNKLQGIGIMGGVKKKRMIQRKSKTRKKIIKTKIKKTNKKYK